VVTVGDGAAALEALQQEPFPLVVSDWMMPRLSGIELIRAVRAREAQRSAEAAAQGYTYLILLTALDSKANYLEGMDAGADDLLTKPFDPEQLAARLRVAERLIGILRRIQQLSGLLPICARCKKIRDDTKPGEGKASRPAWVPVESYVVQRSEASFSHGVCPDCHEKHLKPQLDELKKGRGR
jgi:CheY-like chemotaxis protein